MTVGIRPLCVEPNVQDLPMSLYFRLHIWSIGVPSPYGNQTESFTHCDDRCEEIKIQSSGKQEDRLLIIRESKILEKHLDVYIGSHSLCTCRHKCFLYVNLRNKRLHEWYSKEIPCSQIKLKLQYLIISLYPSIYVVNNPKDS